MATEHFCLRWNNHQSTLISVFDNLLESGTLVDCTLAADGRYLKAHKVVLSACSPYLGMLLSQHYDKHPIIILKDVKFDELKAMLDYMYRGEVNISQEQLSTFLKAAETLQIKGLTDTGGDEGNGVQSNRPPSSNSTTSLPNEEPQSPGPPGDGRNSPSPKKRKRNKHIDEYLDSESQAKLVLSDGSDRSVRDSISISGTPSSINPLSALKNVSFGSVKREPSDTDGDGQMSVDESGDSTMLSRPGPSNGSGSNNKGSPWVLSADSTGEEMQLTPGQDGDQEMIEKPDINHGVAQKDSVLEYHGNKVTEPHVVKSEPNNDEQEGSVGNSVAIYNDNDSEEELIVPDLLENSVHASNRYLDCIEKGQSNRIRVIHPEQLGLSAHHSSQDPLSESNTSSNKNDYTEARMLTDKAPETLKDSSSSKQCSILKSSNEQQLAAKNFINVSNEMKSNTNTDEDKFEPANSLLKSKNLEPNSTAGPVTRSRVGAGSSKSVPNVRTKFRKILPVPKPRPNSLTHHENQESQSQSTSPVNPQGVSTVPYTFSFATPSSSQQNNLSLQMQPQFTISPSQIQDGRLTQSTSIPTNSAASHQINTNQMNLSIQPKYTFSTPQFQSTNIQTLTGIVPQQYAGSSPQTIKSQNIVINRPSRSMSVTQPVLVAPKVVGTTEPSNQPTGMITRPEYKRRPTAYVRTNRGFVKAHDNNQVAVARVRNKSLLLLKPGQLKTIFPKILPKPVLPKPEHLQTLRTVRESTEFIITSLNSNANN